MIAFRYRLLPGSRIQANASGGLQILTPRSEVSLGVCTPGVVSALERLQFEGAAETDLVNEVVARDGETALSKLYLCLLELEEELQISRVVDADGSPLASLVPISTRFHFTGVEADPNRTYALSRFTYVFRLGDELVMESPCSHSRVVFHDWRAPSLLERMARPFRLTDMERGPVSPDAASSTAAVLLDAGMLSEIGRKDSTPESASGTAAVWEFHDLLFHARSREGRHSNPYGRRERFPELRPTAVKSPMSDEIVRLHQPDMARLLEVDVPFSRVLENRVSERIHDEKPITLLELGEFLFRAARIRATIQAKEGKLTRRPYPGAGAAYELEIYPVIHKCDGIEPGLYHYCPSLHRLERLAAPPPAVQQLLASAAGIIHADPPQILFVLAARFSRLMWRYASIGYALILKDLGGLYQTMYLVASAMGLAACAVGGGDSDLFAEASGLNYLEEGAVGEFVIGRRRA